MFSSRALTQFIVLAEELHFGRAAQRLHMSQPPLSQAIMRLEEALGVRLLDRSRSSVALTDAGSVFLHEARRLLEQQALAVDHTRQVSAGMSGTVALGFVGSVSYGLLPLMLAEFRIKFPDVRFDLRELPSSDQLRELEGRRIDIGIVRLPLANAADLHLKTIHRERMIAVLPSAHRLAKERTIRLAELSDETFMLFPVNRVPSLHAQTVMACQAVGFSPRVAMEAWQMPTMVSLVAAGVGVALLPAQIKSIPHPGVVYRDIQDSVHGLDLEIALAWRRNMRSTLCQRIVEALPEV